MFTALLQPKDWIAATIDNTIKKHTEDNAKLAKTLYKTSDITFLVTTVRE